ncbi:MAG: hypothetical protein EKK63_12645 [Acinetobacter sp.]|uniref:hypothetical protein n=1 Tax=Acinetobacter sp. TaxID=472 RepID=UPI000FB3EAF1|nr:hypothetical protein [Acinetobacter sp.]RUP38222.1 MAG: hypothetical protein EKK63_12645 [Acinetobacter sp.]
MASIFQSRKEGTSVLPSGVQASYRSLTGKHQEQITINDEDKRRAGIDNILVDCLISIGDDTEVTLKKVQALLVEDRKALLFALRQLSNQENKEFRFEYEFPTQGGKKMKDAYKVNFTKDDFPVTPYKWVRTAIEKKYMEERGIESEKDLTDTDKTAILNEELPVLFTSYEEMLKEHKMQELELPECKVRVKYQLLDGVRELEFIKTLKKDTISSHTYLSQRKPKYLDPEKLKAEKEVWLDVPFGELGIPDIEALRKHMKDTEANVETTVVVQYKDNPAIQAQVDLVSTPAFFFPSLAV